MINNDYIQYVQYLDKRTKVTVRRFYLIFYQTCTFFYANFIVIVLDTQVLNIAVVIHDTLMRLICKVHKVEYKVTHC